MTSFSNTQEEDEDGFLDGPFSEREVTQLLGSKQWVAIRRFGLQQSSKIRPIDNASDAQLNDSFGPSMRLVLQDCDYLAAMAILVARKMKEMGSAVPWVGKTLDLSKAYKQVPISQKDRRLAVVFLDDACGQRKFFLSNSLLFGASASVPSFLRISRSLHFLFNKMLHVASSCYFDDFPLLSTESLAESADWACSRLLDLLGWKHARSGEGHKGLPFSAKFEVLGTVADVSELHHGIFRMANKSSRVEKVTERLRDVHESGALQRHDGQILLGLLRFAAGFFSGMTLKHVCVDLNRFVYAGAKPSADVLRNLCERAIQAISVLPPREIRLEHDPSVVHIWTDGSWENKIAGIGAVVLDGSRGFGAVFQDEVPKEVLEEWSRTVGDGDHLICQIELFVVWAIKLSLGDMLKNRRVIMWIDNESARLGLVKGYSSSPSMDRLLRDVCALEDSCPSLSWYARVPSWSNVADAPSRFAGQTVLHMVGATELSSFGKLPVERFLLQH